MRTLIPRIAFIGMLLPTLAPATPFGGQTNIVTVRDGTPFSTRVPVGYGAVLDSQGNWNLAKPVFVLAGPLPPPQTPGAGTWRSTYEIDGEEVGLSTGAGVRLEIATPTVKVAAQAGRSQASHKRSTSGAMLVDYFQDWTGTDATDQQIQLSLTPLAVYVLSIQDLELRSQLWRQHFGTHVVIGEAWSASIGVRIAVSSTATLTTQDFFFRLNAEYGPADLSVRLGELLHRAMANSEMNVSIHYTGSRKLDLSIPSPDSLDTTTEQLAFANALASQLGYSKIRTGARLIDAPSLFELPHLGPVQHEDSLLRQAGGAAASSLYKLELTNPYVELVDLNYFLSQQVLPGLQVSYADYIAGTREDLIVRMDDLWASYSAYLVSPGTFERIRLEAAVRALQDSGIAMDDAIAQVDSLRNSLPLPTLTVREFYNRSPHPDQWGMQAWSLWELTLDNAAVFGNGSLETVRRWFSTCSSEDPNDQQSVVFWQLHSNGGPFVPMTACDFWPSYDTHGIEDLSVDDIRTNANGLKRITLRMRVNGNRGLQQGSVTVRDMFRRPASWGPYFISDGASHPL